MMPYTFMDESRLIPVDVDAEESLAGLAIVSGEQAGRLLTAVTPLDFHDGRCWQVIEAAGAVAPEVADGYEEWAEATEMGDHAMVVFGCAARVAAIATATVIEASWLRYLVTVRSVQPVATLLRRLAEAKEARRRNADLLVDLDRNGVDTAALTEADARRQEIRNVIEEAARALGRLLAGHADVELIDALIQLGRVVGVDAGPIIAQAAREDT
jgi:hypothetical protein